MISRFLIIQDRTKRSRAAGRGSSFFFHSAMICTDFGIYRVEPPHPGRPNGEAIRNFGNTRICGNRFNEALP